MDKQALFKVIIEICNSVLLPEKGNTDIHLPEFTAKDWNELFAQASLHGMLPTLIHFFEGRQIEDKQHRMILIKWYAAAQKYKTSYHLRLQSMRELADMFAEDGLDVMFFKGASLAQMYPNPEWRVFSDIDFYLYGKCGDGNKAMARHGIKSRPFYHHNTEATLHGILLENHYDFMDRLNHRSNLALDDELKKLVSEEGKSRRATFFDKELKNAYVMTPTMDAIFLMRHMAAHFASESIPLKMLYDWILFMKNYFEEVDWGRVCKLYSASGMSEFVGLVQTLIDTYFVANLPRIPVEFIDSEKVGRVWDSIVFPPTSNPHKKYTISYYIQEAQTYFDNKWKHKIVFPDESYLLLSLHYAWAVLKKKLGLLKMKEG